MRTIKFRGKSDGAWVTWFHYIIPARQHKKHEGVTEKGLALAVHTYDVDEDTVGQFTGLYDKNGKEIYEGDIVRHPYIDPIFGDLVDSENDEDNPVSEVVFNEGSFTLRFRDTHYYLGEFVRKGMAEVVGNVHDNAELLK